MGQLSVLGGIVALWPDCSSPRHRAQHRRVPGDEETKLPPTRYHVRGSRSVPGSQSPFVAAVCPQVTLTSKGLEEYVEWGQGEDQVVYQVRPPARKQTQPWASQEDGNRFCFCKAKVEGTSPFSRGARRAASLSVSHVHFPTQG